MEQKATAANGVNVYYYRLPNTHSICISLYIRAGTLFENGNTGITHFLEHMHFRKLGGMKQKELYHKLESMGADFGACTYKEFMRLYITASPRYFRETARIAAALLGPLEAAEEDVVREKRLILSEIREDNQKNDIDFVSNKYIWEGTTLENPVLGYMDSIRGITLEALRAEKEKVFINQNIFFYVTGCFDDGDISLLLDEIGLYDMSGRQAAQNRNISQVPASFGHRAAYTRLSQRKYFMHDVKLSFDFDSSKISRPGLMYLDSVLSGGLSSLLRAEIIEKRGLLYSYSSIIEQYNNIGVYFFTFQAHKSKLYETIKGFVTVLKGARADITAEDMDATRVFKTDNQLQLLDDPDGLNWAFAYENHILDGNYRDVAQVAEEYGKITREELIMIANQLFRMENAMLVSIGNKKGLSEARLQNVLSEL